ncbi:MAG TPA: hypothetical protein VMG12_09140 [Polyangiaceae bacterium]|nr:hypothetical protein [Polyangiaceae bacterium]
MKEPKRLLSHGASDFERQLLRAVATERPSALLRSRMQRSLGLVGPLAWASNVKAMFGSMGRKVAVGAAAAGVVVAGGVAAYQLMPRDAAPSGASPNDEAPSMVAPAVIETPAPEAPAVVEAHAVEPAAPPSSAPAADDSEDGRLREEIALLDSVKAALQRGERDQARHSLDTYRERFPDGILRREANVLRQRAEAK